MRGNVKAEGLGDPRAGTFPEEAIARLHLTMPLGVENGGRHLTSERPRALCLN
jgi:hypothetical protein